MIIQEKGNFPLEYINQLIYDFNYSDDSVIRISLGENQMTKLKFQFDYCIENGYLLILENLHLGSKDQIDYIEYKLEYLEINQGMENVNAYFNLFLVSEPTENLNTAIL